MRFLDPLASINGHLVVILWKEVSSSGKFSMYAWKSQSWSNLSFKVSGIAVLHMSTGIMEGSFGISSCVIWVGDGGGGVDIKSTMLSAIKVFVLFSFFGRPCRAPASTNFLNYVSTKTLFATMYSIMLKATTNVPLHPLSMK